jgi:hypothetical protein
MDAWPRDQPQCHLLEASILAAYCSLVGLRKLKSYYYSEHLMFYPRLVTVEADDGSFINVFSVRASPEKDWSA